MWLAFRTGVFTNFCIFFQPQNLEINEMKTRIKKNKEEILKKVKESIMGEEIINDDIGKTVNKKC